MNSAVNWQAVWAITSVGVKRLLQKKGVLLLLFLAWGPVLILGMGFFSMGTHLTKRAVGREEQVKSRLAPRIALPVESHHLFSQLLGREATREVIERRLDELVPLFWRTSFFQFAWMESWVWLFLVLAVGPHIVTPDIRSRSIPLYFSKPIRLTDYTMGKTGIIATLLGFSFLIPAIFLFSISFYFSPTLSLFTSFLDIIPSFIIIYIAFLFISTSIILLSGSSCSTYFISIIYIILLSIGSEMALAFLRWFSSSYPIKLSTDIQRFASLISIPSIFSDISCYLTGVNGELGKLNDILRTEWVMDPISGERGKLGDMPLWGSGNPLWKVCLSAAFYCILSWIVFRKNMAKAQR